jgi:hypothetical protein
VTLHDHVGLGHTERVDPLVDDVPGDAEVLRVDRRAAGDGVRRERLARAALQVESELRCGAVAEEQHGGVEHDKEQRERDEVSARLDLP